MDAVESSVRARLARSAADAARVNDPSAPFLRALADRTEIEEQRDSRVEKLLETAERVAGGQIAKVAASELPRAVERLVLQRFRVMVAAVAGMLVATLVVGAGAGYWFGYRDEAERTLEAQGGLPGALTGEGAVQWLNLMRLNDITRASRTCSQQAGREACSIALWIQPPASPR